MIGGIARSIQALSLQAIAFAVLLAACIPVSANAQDITSGLVGYWKLDEKGNVSTANDSAGSNDGTLTNFPADPTANWMKGKLLRGLDFDGTDDYVTANLSTGSGSSAVSMEFWVSFNTLQSGTKFLTKILENYKHIKVEHKGTPELSYYSEFAFNNQSEIDSLKLIIDACRYEQIRNTYLQNKIYVETNNKITFFSEALLRLYPKAKFVSLKRDPLKFVQSGFSAN